MDINTVIKAISESFQRISDRKRYKLINFAPYWRIVDKLSIVLSISQKQSTHTVGNVYFHVYNKICKKNGIEFSTYQQHIINNISL